MEKPSRITIEGVEYNLLTDEDLSELIFIEKLESQAKDIHDGIIKSISLNDLKREYDEKIRSRSI